MTSFKVVFEVDVKATNAKDAVAMAYEQLMSSSHENNGIALENFLPDSIVPLDKFRCTSVQIRSLYTLMDLEQLRASKKLPQFVYPTLRTLPDLVRVLCFNHDAWVVGGGARYLCGMASAVRDWDVIVPLQEWFKVSKLLPYDSRVSTLGGVKVRTRGVNDQTVEVDVWAEDVGRYFQKSGGAFDLIAVSPLTQQVCMSTPR